MSLTIELNEIFVFASLHKSSYSLNILTLISEYELELVKICSKFSGGEGVGAASALVGLHFISEKVTCEHFQMYPAFCTSCVVIIYARAGWWQPLRPERETFKYPILLLFSARDLNPLS